MTKAFYRLITVLFCLLLNNPLNAGILSPATNILFIGNSYTFVNDLPGTFTKLAKSGGHKVKTEIAAPQGWRLAQHVASPQTLNKIKQQQWDWVVLQEQSQAPASKSIRDQMMYPAVRSLAARIQATGSKPILFMTWGYRDGWPEAGMKDYYEMQARLTAGYIEVGKKLQLPVAPVGRAWLNTRLQHPEIDLWSSDGSHPTEAGTYLSACIFYTVFFQQNPEGISYHGGLPKSTARKLQKIAIETYKSNH